MRNGLLGFDRDRYWWHAGGPCREVRERKNGEKVNVRLKLNNCGRNGTFRRRDKRLSVGAWKMRMENKNSRRNITSVICNFICVRSR